MKIIYIFILSIIPFLGYSQKTKKLPFNIEESYCQSWIAGIKGGGSGTDFYIIFQKELPKEVVLSKLYFQNKMALPNKVTPKEYFFSFKENINCHPNEEISQEEKITKVISSKQAVLEYFYKGNRSFFKIRKIKEKEILAYPSVRTDENDKN
ncbi:hypothetical protein B0A78_09485 [Flavobacterium columnare NBRC 100251 = ATCC 23463]|uniref:Uncharacterized protein n=2 Tax=Flavobacterium columnare TaxID=996 RepID=G8XBD0_FLACA|nr:hypothetical protein [Flavobacterium columnare]AEW86710.1 hypothetical protein FCOL_09505 [Flavobacterium columnare ATCC 49512]AMO20594.1 hypothetical protein UN65_09860 [Flavobacterium columnare]ANO47122.1 hypothetical protein Pf1_01665 [Flavobacterium columnare]APT22194.1 hypothetical protein BU993_05830 [Flavobacterium columnare]AUX18568.1 hypothetical protein AQ623_10010 [Flavobacterium columnare]